MLCLSAFVLQSQSSPWELQLNTNHKKTFEKAYQLFPDIPRGILESVAYTNTHIRHIDPNTEEPSCMGLPSYYGVMGLMEDGTHYFRNNLSLVSRISDNSIEEIKNDPTINIISYAKAYDILIQEYGITSSSPEDHIIILDALSELPNDGVLRNNFAFDSHIYSVLRNLNEKKFQAIYNLPDYQIDIEKVFGRERYLILSASEVFIGDNGISNSSGNTYSNNGQRFTGLPCNDLGNQFPFAVIQDAAHSSNYSSRAGSAITHVTVHTIQGTYAGAIAYFKMSSANVSCHYNMRCTDGQITQMVCEADKAWHACNANPFAVGIEHEGYVADPSWYTNVMYESSSSLTKSIAARNNIPILKAYDVNGEHGVHHNSNNCFSIKGHMHYPSNNHSDPGQYWDWHRYYDLINPVDSANSNTFTNPAGTFYDSGGSTGNYTNIERVFYRIAPPGATSVTLNFNSIDLELNYDYLYIYDGDSHNDKLLAVLNGTTTPSPITALSGKMLLEFRSDCGTVGAGWDAYWSTGYTPATCDKPTGLTTSNHSPNGLTLNWVAVTGASSYEIKVKQSLHNLNFTTYYSNTNNFDLTGLPSDSKYLWSVRAICGVGDTSALEGDEFINAEVTADETTTACTGKFTDTGGELGMYRKNEDYTFTIAPPNATQLTLTFSAFDLENNYDYMYIYDGPTTAYPLLGTYTSTNMPPVTVASNGALCIRFYSDVATQNPGWVATWDCNGSGATVPTAHPTTILLDASVSANLNCGINYHDFFDSGGSNGNYSNNENNVKTFCNPDPNKAVRLSFRPNPNADRQLSIRSYSTGNDYMYIYNGPDTNSNLIGVYTGTTSAAPQPGSFISSGTCMTVKMNSNNSLVGSGWIARLYCSDKPTNLALVEVGGTQGNHIFTDLGGSTAYYGNNENYTSTFCPHSSTPNDEVVWANFLDTIGLEYNWDYLYVFDGPNTETSRLINTYTGDSSGSNVLGTIKATTENSSGCLTFQFFSDGATTKSGWEALITTGKARKSYGSDNCSSATQIIEENTTYAGSTMLATGIPDISDPIPNISIASLPECSGTNTITRLENTIWYTFTTVDTFCINDQIAIKLDNISCQSTPKSGSGVQFVLYEVNNCQNGSSWGNPIYCADKLLSGDSVVITSLLQQNTTYYIMIDGFAAQHCNFDIRMENKDQTGCTVITQTKPTEIITNLFRSYPNPVSNIINFEYDNPEDCDYNLRIYDITGRTIYEMEGEMTSGFWKEQLNTSQLNTGMYIYQIQIGNQAINGKFEKH